jgi:hypothetical protein
MSGYLQRLALNVLEPRESIRPVLGSLFSGAAAYGISGDLPLETERPAPAGTVFESVPQTTPPLADSKRLSPDPEPGAEEKKSPQSIFNPVSGSTQAALVPGPGEKTRAFLAHNLPSKRGDERHEEVLRTSQSEPTERTLETRAVENQLPKKAASESAGFANRFPPASDSASLISKTGAKTETRLVPLLVRNDDQPQSESLKRPETSASTLPRAEAKRLSGQTAADALVPKVAGGPPVRQGPTTVAKQAFRTMVVPRSDPHGKKGMPDSRTSRPEPDEIQIHIGRIEVIAVPPAPPAPPPPKRKPGAPSLNEYLQRRNGRSV